MPVSIKDIAKKAGVSPSTVSRALSEHPRISQETRRQVKQLAQEMGYIPSAVARSLVSCQTNTIGVAVNDFLNPFYVDLISNIENAVLAGQYHVFVSSFHRDRQREISLVRAFLEQRLAGIIVIGSLVDQDYLTWPYHNTTPIVLISCPSYLFSVTVDNSLGLKKAAAHLIELGHRRIAFVTQGHRTSTEQQRLEGYGAELSANDIPFDQTLVIDGDGSITGGVQAVPQLLALPERPTAILCYNDMTAIGVINGLQHRGYHVPQDFSVVGFDDLTIASAYSPALTTVRQPTDRLGKAAIAILHELEKGHQKIQPQIVRPELIVRQSTAPVAAG